MMSKKKINLKYIVDALVENVIELYNPNEHPKDMSIKTSDFINALKLISDLKGLKKVKVISFKGDQDITYDGESDS